MSARKKPVFGVISLVLMVGLAVASILVTIYGPPPTPVSEDESLAVAVGAAANIIATLLIIATVSLGSVISAGIGLLRGEPRWPAAAGLCLAVPSLLVVILTVARL